MVMFYTKIVFCVVFITEVINALQVDTGYVRADPPLTLQPGTILTRTFEIIIPKGHVPNNLVSRLYGGLLKRTHRKNFATSQSVILSKNNTHDKYRLTLNLRIPRPHYDYDVRSTQPNSIYRPFTMKMVLNSGESDHYNFTWNTDCAYKCEQCISARPKCSRCRMGFILQDYSCYPNKCSSFPCMDGSCTSYKSTYTCECPSGKSGRRCTTSCNGRHCESCNAYGYCYVCRAGWTLASGSCIVDPCANSSCTQGHCVLYRNLTTSCLCNYGMGGRLCDTPCITDHCKTCGRGLTTCRQCIPKYRLSLGQCTQCPDRCNKCDRDQRTCDPGGCEAHYGLIDGIGCQRCLDHNCFRCDGETSRCNVGHCRYSYGLHQITGQCQPCADRYCTRCDVDRQKCDERRCTRGYIYHTELKMCIHCLSRCQSCLPNNIECDLRVHRYRIAFQGACTSHCLECDNSLSCKKGRCEIGYGTGVRNHTCIKCPSNCDKCDVNILRCDLGGCHPGYGLNEENEQCEQCIDNCLHCDQDINKCDWKQCALGYGEDEGECKECLPNCLECGQSQFCTYAQCALGYGLAEGSDTCEKCPANCLDCQQTDQSSCDIGGCEVGYRLMANNTCLPCIEGCSQCKHNLNVCDLGKCSPGYVINQRRICVSMCPAHCISCRHPPRCDEDKCEQPYTFFPDTGACGYCVANCATCSNALSCDPDGCEPLFSYFPLTGLCGECPVFCKRCSQPGHCDAGQCEDRYTLVVYSGRCEHCPMHCMKCSSLIDCIICDPLYELNNATNECVLSHTDGDSREPEAVDVKINRGAAFAIASLLFAVAVAPGIICYIIDRSIKTPLSSQDSMVESVTEDEGDFTKGGLPVPSVPIRSTHTIVSHGTNSASRYSPSLRTSDAMRFPSPHLLTRQPSTMLSTSSLSAQI